MAACPVCHGLKRSTVHVNRGSGPHTWEEWACSNCQGTGEVTQSRLEAYRTGRTINALRKDQRWTLRQLAQMLELDNVTLSHVENGRLDLNVTTGILMRVQSLIQTGESEGE